MHSLQKILTRVRGTNFCPSSARFASSFVRQPNGPKCTQIVQNTPKHQIRVQWGGWVRSLRKIPLRLRGTNFCTSLARFALTSVRQTNGPKCTQIVRNAPKNKFRVQWGGSGAFVVKHSDSTLWHKLLHKFGPFSTEFCKATKRFRMHPNGTNTPKCQFRV